MNHGMCTTHCTLKIQHTKQLQNGRCLSQKLVRPVLENFCSGYFMVLSRKLVTCKIVIPSHDLNFHSRKIGWLRKPAVKGDVRPTCTYMDQNEKKNNS